MSHTDAHKLEVYGNTLVQNKSGINNETLNKNSLFDNINRDVKQEKVI